MNNFSVMLLYCKMDDNVFKQLTELVVFIYTVLTITYKILYEFQIID